MIRLTHCILEINESISELMFTIFKYIFAIKPFTKSLCDASGGKGTCIYPNEAQCSEKQEKPRVNSVHVNIGRYYPKTF